MVSLEATYYDVEPDRYDDDRNLLTRTLKAGIEQP